MNDNEFDKLLEGITFGDVLRAVADLADGADHDFHDAKYRDLIVSRRPFPVRPVIAFAVRRQLQGQLLTKQDFDGSKDTKCARHLAALGFAIEQR